ncbi:Conserved oligomeric Golgi complex subunit [Yamadazyma tenuis]|uniref:Conserved oligomeric Golgi complex subunit 5 n=1 Tax=Candida tenuis (strain ATCC 10573 / BCRC 21748 / CBS 615 / JCM 9827 / NBRC 10315 / NRRL Y-1498 / VKM Y-70) TaxID=590646 RepID=G3B690_CANTC|nr:uncharacterized protein CANTEDRAFT_123633 [Yamadazyma tenuis ATCC 10573]EGV63415.1 hypothetical protein CANTEDRAFT_123633 [Yamadazyma tenuis ATCC 10573]WEJ96764.1 Conserved oligomeric Golgi complex subunit [Yamadazyma tenuis]
MKGQDELEDFEAFLEKDFSTYKFANDLLLATNDRDTTEIDIDTSIKKLTFDIDEVEKRMTSISSQNHESLVANFSEIEHTNNVIKQKITPSLGRVNGSFQKIKSEIIEPFDEAQKMNSALKKVHTTLDLLRGSNFFFLLVSQVEDLEKSVQKDDKTKKNNDLIKLAKLYKQITELYESERTTKENELRVSLVTIKIIRDYQVVHINKNHQLVNTCMETIVNEFSHNTTFTTANIKLQHNLIAYYILQRDRFLDTLERATIAKHVNTISSQLSRSLQSPRNFIVILKEVKTASMDFLSKLTTILQSCEIYRLENTTTLYRILLEEFGSQSLEQIYWSKLVARFKKGIASTMARGGPIAKNLKTYQPGIQNSLKETFNSSEEHEQLDLFLDAVELISLGR